MKERRRQVALPAALAACHQHPRLVHASACRGGTLLTAVNQGCRVLMSQTQPRIAFLLSACDALTNASPKFGIMYWILVTLLPGIAC